MININDFWDKVAYPNDTSQALTAALAIAPYQAVYFPAGQYWLKDVSISKDTEIICDLNADIQGVSNTDTLLKAEGSVFRVSIRGGVWSNCDTVFSHTGTSVLSDSHFTEMRVTNVNTGFALDGSIGNKWNGCRFQNDVTNGILFLGVVSPNANIINQCKFMSIDNAIIFNGGAGNVVRDGWFENLTNGIQLIDTFSTLIEGCWFEGNSGRDIDISVWCRVINIHANHFGGGAAAQTYRIETSGDSDFNAVGNWIGLQNENQDFAYLDGTGVDNTVFLRNYLNGPGGGSYASRLFTNNSGQHVRYDMGVGSWSMTDDADPVEAIGRGSIELAEMGNPPNPPQANGARVFLQDNGSGKTELCIIFPSGTVQTIKTEL